MFSPAIQKYLNQSLPQVLGISISSMQLEAVGGGSINETYHVIINHHNSFFLKFNSAKSFPALFATEKNGLEFLKKQNVIKIPSVVAVEENAELQFLVLEWIRTGQKTPHFWNLFGEQLAALHRKADPQFGFHEDNYMGALPQSNMRQKDWASFFVHQRLEPQVLMARHKGLLNSNHLESFESVFKNAPSIFNEESPSLLHGDLWSGNFMCDDSSTPVLIDPAIYYGHRSMDLAMTTLFGGFDHGFYESYHYHFPLPSNYREQWDICNLYPLLIHLNLFGAGYLNQIEPILKKFR